MNIQHDRVLLNLTGVGAMCFKVFYITRWLKANKFCGEFKTLCEASNHVDWMQKKLPNGKKIAFRIQG